MNEKRLSQLVLNYFIGNYDTEQIVKFLKSGVKKEEEIINTLVYHAQKWDAIEVNDEGVTPEQNKELDEIIKNATDELSLINNK